MIYCGFNFLAEYLESLYLGDALTDRMSKATIVVNPLTDRYIYGKTIIISSPDVSQDYIRKLSQNNTIIFRIQYPLGLGQFHPYLPKIIRGITWAGYSIPTVSIKTAQDLPDYFCSPDHINYPSVLEPTEISDDSGNLNYLGYILYQIGSLRWPTDTVYQDLDLYKIPKINI